MSSTPRLFVTEPLALGDEFTLNIDQSHYLSTVMRREAGDPVRLFNGADGDWRAVIVKAGKKTVLRCEALMRPQSAAPDLHLLFAPVKKARTDFIVEKATELGAAALIPVFTERSIAERVRTDRLDSIAREAAEQTERLDLPKIYPPQKLGPILDAWNSDRALIWCDEAGDDESAPWGGANGRAPAALDILRNALCDPAPALPLGGGRPELEAASQRKYGKVAVLVGPEGGFSPAERERLRAHVNVIPVSLGPRILRADTACVAALTLVQAVWGDWRQEG